MMPTVSLLVILFSISQIMNATHSLEKLHGHNQGYTHIKLNYINNMYIQSDQNSVELHIIMLIPSYNKWHWQGIKKYRKTRFHEDVIKIYGLVVSEKQLWCVLRFLQWYGYKLFRHMTLYDCIAGS